MWALLRKFQPIARVLIQRPQFFVHQNATRLRTKPKIQEMPIPYIEREMFISESTFILHRIEKQFKLLRTYEPRIKSIAEDYDPTTDSHKLTVDIENFGSYIFTTLPRERVLYYQSPLTGVSKYFFDEANQNWISNKDKHLLLESLVRETAKYLKGYLDF